MDELLARLVELEDIITNSSDILELAKAERAKVHFKIYQQTVDLPIATVEKIIKEYFENHRK